MNILINILTLSFILIKIIQICRCNIKKVKLFDIFNKEIYLSLSGLHNKFSINSKGLNIAEYDMISTTTVIFHIFSFRIYRCNIHRWMHFGVSYIPTEVHNITTI